MPLLHFARFCTRLSVAFIGCFTLAGCAHGDSALTYYWQSVRGHAGIMLAAQPLWADHGSPNIGLAYKAAEQGGLDLQKALADAAAPTIDAVLRQDVEDLTALGVNKTPTFFVNGRPLPSFGEAQLTALVAEEVAKARR